MRLIILVKEDFKVVNRDDISDDGVLWLDLVTPGRSVTLAGVYRAWLGLSKEQERLQGLLHTTEMVACSNRGVILTGDFNLDTRRLGDTTYSRRHLANHLVDTLEDLGLMHHNTGFTYRSHGCYNGAHRQSVIDHVFSMGLKVTDVNVVENHLTDHRPLAFKLDMGSLERRAGLKQVASRNFKAIDRRTLEEALQEHDWTPLYAIHDASEVLSHIERAITATLDRVAPLRTCTVRDRGPDLYLTKETRQAMAARDAAKTKEEYKRLRNAATKLVRRDKLISNLKSLDEVRDDPQALWRLADQALGKSKAPPPHAGQRQLPSRGQRCGRAREQVFN